MDPVLFIETPEGRVIDTGARKNPKQLARLEAAVAEATARGDEWLCPGKFGVADVAVGAYLLYVPQFFPDVNMGKWPQVSAYMLRCAEREAYGRAYGDRAAGYIVGKCREYANGGGGKKGGVGNVLKNVLGN